MQSSCRGSSLSLKNILPIVVLCTLAVGLSLGYFFPDSPIVHGLYVLGTYFPKAIVTFSALIIFLLLGGAIAKLILMHRERAGRFFGIVLIMYLSMGMVSLIYVTLWAPLLTGIPLINDDGLISGPYEVFTNVAGTFSTILTQQPLVQVLFGSLVAGYLAATIKRLRPIANGLIWSSNIILKIFKFLIWYYPFMIGMLAIGIPMKFGSNGLVMYGQTVIQVAFITISWSIIMILATKLLTKKTFTQILAYYSMVWTTGFGTGGSYDTLAVNIMSAKKDLGLHAEIADVSIVFGTVLNKNCSTMSILLVTVTVCKILGIPISILELAVLIPPVMIMGLESPGIPGGAGFFMSPIIAIVLNVTDVQLFVTTFVTVFSGFIPMLSTAGNTTDDGMVGAILQDRFAHELHLDEAKEIFLKEGRSNA